MKRNMMRIVAVIFALMLTMGMSSAVFADDTGENIAAFTKTVRLVDSTDGITVYAPSITYEYAVNTTALGNDELGYITNAEAAASDTNGYGDAYTTYDKNMSTAGVTVKDGATATGHPTVTLTYGETTSKTVDVPFSNSDSGTETSGHYDVTKNVTINATAGTVTGIYRYKITESLASGSNTKAAAGITPSADYVATRYLDVYVTNVSGTPAVTNVVLFRHTNNADTKVQGWTDSNDLDTYETVDVTIKKEITGALADTTHNFPFVFEATASNGSKVSYGKSTSSLTALEFGTKANTTLTNNETIVIYGVPKASIATVTATETNDTSDTYTVSTSGLASDLEGVAETAGTANIGGATSTITADSTITFTNNLEQISPTNVVMRFAPFLFIFGAAILLLVMMRRRKAHNEE